MLASSQGDSSFHFYRIAKRTRRGTLDPSWSTVWATPTACIMCPCRWQELSARSAGRAERRSARTAMTPGRQRLRVRRRDAVPVLEFCRCFESAEVNTTSSVRSDQHRDVANLVTGIGVAVRFGDLVQRKSPPDHGAKLARVDQFLQEEPRAPYTASPGAKRVTLRRTRSTVPARSTPRIGAS